METIKSLVNVNINLERMVIEGYDKTWIKINKTKYHIAIYMWGNPNVRCEDVKKSSFYRFSSTF